MLDPRDRQHLLEILRPPQIVKKEALIRYELDSAIGTTFSLDLQALLTVPLAFALFDWEDKEGRPVAERLAIMEAMRRYSDRIAVFCQAGNISIPKKHEILFHYLEEAVIQVSPPRGIGVFHPKVWILRFKATGENDTPVIYRLICLTRNLTFDRSWDITLVLEGQMRARERGFAVNNPLGDFIAALPRMATAVPIRVKNLVGQFQQEIRRVEFDPPDGFESYNFWTGGLHTTSRLPFEDRYNRMLIMSPFIKAGLLRKIAKSGSQHVLISRIEELDKLKPSELKAFKEIYYLNDAANLESSEEENDESGKEQIQLQGLHAKLYVAEEGSRCHVWTGSANATDSGFGQNIEFLVGLVSKRNGMSIGALLKRSQSKERVHFADLLMEYKPSKTITTDDEEKEKLDRQAQQVARKLSRTGMIAKITSDDGSFVIDLRTRKRLILPPGVTIQCWPISRSESFAIELQRNSTLVAKFINISFEAITSFYAFMVKVMGRKVQGVHRFVLNVPLQGAPADRHERLLRYVLLNKQDVMRYFFFLLNDGTSDLRLPASRESFSGSGKLAQKIFGESNGLFEYLVRALVHEPAMLDRVDHVVRDLRKSDDYESLLPDGFDTIWEPIWRAREGLIK